MLKSCDLAIKDLAKRCIKDPGMEFFCVKFSCSQYLKKTSIIDAFQGPKYTSA